MSATVPRKECVIDLHDREVFLRSVAYHLSAASAHVLSGLAQTSPTKIHQSFMSLVIDGQPYGGSVKFVEVDAACNVVVVLRADYVGLGDYPDYYVIVSAKARGTYGRAVKQAASELQVHPRAVFCLDSDDEHVDFGLIRRECM